MTECKEVNYVIHTEDNYVPWSQIQKKRLMSEIACKDL